MKVRNEKIQSKPKQVGKNIIVGNAAVSSKKSVTSVDQIPITIPKDAQDILWGQEDEPRFIVEEIGFPVAGDQGVYELGFFQDFENVVRKGPVPGSREGHYSKGSDVFTVGTLIVDNGGTGTAYLRVFVPEVGFNGDNEGVLRDLLLGNVSMSIQCTALAESMIPDANGMYHFIGIDGTQPVHNDIAAAPYMESVTVHNQAPTNLESTPTGASNITDTGRKAMDKAQALAFLAGLYSNGLISMVEVANGIGLTAPSFLRNDVDVANGKAIDELKVILGPNYLDTAKQVANERTMYLETIRDAKVVAKFGGQTTKNLLGEDVVNPVFAYAKVQCANCIGEALDKKIVELEKDPTILAMRKMLVQNSAPNRPAEAFVSADVAQTIEV